MLFPLIVLALSEWELNYGWARIYPAALLLPLPLHFRKSSWAEVMIASILGGLLCWKTSDAWPLFGGSTALQATLLIALAVLLCRGRKDRLLACAMGSLFFELFFCLREHMLFSYCVIRLGSRDALSLSTASICLYAVLEQVRFTAFVREKQGVHIGN